MWSAQLASVARTLDHPDQRPQAVLAIKGVKLSNQLIGPDVHVHLVRSRNDIVDFRPRQDKAANSVWRGTLHSAFDCYLDFSLRLGQFTLLSREDLLLPGTGSTSTPIHQGQTRHTDTRNPWEPGT
ncbi:hypothetical protein SARC_14569 [Sphaeroforma arctica JP610]|uniref:Uncharacterized protein n=1 Tax=Sphaeroforma arctica JP610 TaxID=667725 RepID=A0A0L0F8J8_9EUKA|nr:hypothetical protein SARC_14569 [Sphaeroforma arctica JP610]KNC72871.1 hypothetical protein SARC_14569 [Sphaeroforma arctica JP610]|eukprot:XP_014146773.1 hypothetical protein SARC_14569 [Sphaeroforma arctica JP610]